MTTARRVALDESVTRRAFQDFAFDHRWKLRGVVDQEDAPYEEIWSTDDSGQMAHYIEDPLINVAYILLVGEQVEDAATQLVRGLATISPSEAARAARTAANKAERMRSVAFLAAAAPEVADPEILAAFQDLLADPDPEVRDNAIFGSVYPLWPEIDELLERVRDDDPEPHIREAAGNALAAIARHRNGDGP